MSDGCDANGCNGPLVQVWTVIAPDGRKYYPKLCARHAEPIARVLSWSERAIRRPLAERLDDLWIKEN